MIDGSFCLSYVVCNGAIPKDHSATLVRRGKDMLSGECERVDCQASYAVNSGQLYRLAGMAPSDR